MAGKITFLKKDGVYSKNMTKDMILDFEKSVKKAKELVEARGENRNLISRSNSAAVNAGIRKTKR